MPSTQQPSSCPRQHRRELDWKSQRLMSVKQYHLPSRKQIRPKFHLQLYANVLFVPLLRERARSKVVELILYCVPLGQVIHRSTKTATFGLQPHAKCSRLCRWQRHSRKGKAVNIAAFSGAKISLAIFKSSCARLRNGLSCPSAKCPYVTAKIRDPVYLSKGIIIN